MTDRRNVPFPPVVPYADLVVGELLSEHQGQSRLVGRLSAHSGWLYKEYKAPLRPDEQNRLTTMITLPRTLPPDEWAVILRDTSWPVARVERDGGTCGVILPEAAKSYEADFRLPSGKTQHRTVTVDWLAQPAAAQQARGLPSPSLPQRVVACASLAATAALFERHGVVYLDWSFTNAFWSPREHTAFVIDVDGCSVGPRLMIQCPGWEDPLHPMGSEGGLPVDRYKVAVLVARCLTAERTTSDAAAAAARLGELAKARRELGPLHGLVDRAVGAARAQDRPDLRELSAALDAAAEVLGCPRPGAVPAARPIPGPVRRVPAGRVPVGGGRPDRPVRSNPRTGPRIRAGDRSTSSDPPPRPGFIHPPAQRPPDPNEVDTSALVAIVLGVLALIVFVLLFALL